MPKEIKVLGKRIPEAIAWYRIGGLEFYQDTLCYGQSVRLLPYLDGVSFDDLQSKEVLAHLGDRIGETLEIILVPKGVSQEDHILALEVPGTIERAAWFSRNLTHLDLMEIIEDFFACNLDASLMNRIIKWFQGILMQAKGTMSPKANELSPSSPEATPLIVPQSLAENLAS